MLKYFDLKTCLLLLIIIVLSALNIQGGKAMDEAKGAVTSMQEQLQESPANLAVEVTNLTTEQKVRLGCTLGSDVAGVSDYSMEVFADGKLPALYGCSHLKVDILQ